MDTITYRFSGHSHSDEMTYRTKEELEAFKAQDPVFAYGRYIVENGLVTEDNLKEMQTAVLAKMRKALEITVDEKLSPMVDGQFIESVMFSNGNIEKLDDRDPELSMPLEENPRVQQIARRARYAFDEEGKELPASRQYQYRDAVFRGDGAPVLHRPDPRSHTVRTPRLGRSVRLLPRTYGIVAVPSVLQLSDQRIGDRGERSRLCDVRGRAVVELMYCDFLDVQATRCSTRWRSGNPCQQEH